MGKLRDCCKNLATDFPILSNTFQVFADWEDVVSIVGMRSRIALIAFKEIASKDGIISTTCTSMNTAVFKNCRVGLDRVG